MHIYLRASELFSGADVLSFCLPRDSKYVSFSWANKSPRLKNFLVPLCSVEKWLLVTFNAFS